MSIETGGSEHLDPMIAAEAAKFNAEQKAESNTLQEAENALRELLVRRHEIDKLNFDPEDIEDYKEASDEELHNTIDQLRKSTEFDKFKLNQPEYTEEGGAYKEIGDGLQQQIDLNAEHARLLENYLAARRTAG